MGPIVTASSRLGDRHPLLVLLAGQGISVLGDQLHTLALPWLILDRYGDVGVLGLVTTTTTVTRIAALLLGGVLVDRFSARYVMLWSDILRLTLTGLLAGIWSTARPPIWELTLICAVLGALDGVFYPASNSIIPQLVDQTQIPKGTSAQQVTFMLSMLVGPVLAGQLFSRLGGAAVLALDAITFAVSAGTLVLIPGRRQSGNDRESLKQLLMGGSSYVYRSPVLRLVALGSVFATTVGTVAISLVLPFWGESELGLSVSTFGWVMSAMGLGLAVGAATAGGLHLRRRRGTVALVCLAGVGISLSALVARHQAGWQLACAAVMGLFMGLANVSGMVLIQERTDPEYLGRVMALLTLGSMGLTPLALPLAADALKRFGATWVLLALGGTLLIGAVTMASNILRLESSEL